MFRSDFGWISLLFLLAVGYSEFKFRRLTIPVLQKGTQHIAASGSPSPKESRCQVHLLSD